MALEGPLPCRAWCSLLRILWEMECMCSTGSGPVNSLIRQRASLVMAAASTSAERRSAMRNVPEWRPLVVDRQRLFAVNWSQRIGVSGGAREARWRMACR